MRMILGSPVNGQEYQEIHNEKKTKQKCWIAVQPSKWGSENDFQQENGTEEDKLLTLQHIGGAVMFIQTCGRVVTPAGLTTDCGKCDTPCCQAGTANLNFLH